MLPYKDARGLDRGIDIESHSMFAPGILLAADNVGIIAGVLGFLDQAPHLLLGVAALLLVAPLAFLGFFCFPAFLLGRRLRSFSKEVLSLKEGLIVDPRTINITDDRLSHLWHEYCDTLHEPRDTLDPLTGVPRIGSRRATVPAETIFNSLSVFEGRIHAEFFKHLPGLLTGIGIIGTFIGLINGLGAANKGDGGLDTALLIASVKEAFYISALAIILAMIATFIEKVVISTFHRRVEHLCEQIDSLYRSGAGEEYLSRLVAASEESASQARILKDALVGDLRRILEEMTQRQIEASSHQQAELTRQFGGLLEQGIGAPLGQVAERLGGSNSQSLQDSIAALSEKFDRVANGIERMGSNQGEQLASGLGDSMVTFAAKLDQMLGGQIGQARELQAETTATLKNAINSIEAMAAKIGAAGEGATTSISEQLRSALTSMSEQQRMMAESMRNVADELRASVANAQSTTSQGVESLLTSLGGHVEEVVSRLQGDTEKLSQHTTASLEELAGSVKAQTISVEEAARAMRGAIADLGSAVNSNIAMMADGAGEIRLASEHFAGSGQAVSDVLDRSRVVAAEFTDLAQTLLASAQDIRSVVADYRSARETLGSIVAGLNETIANARRDASMTSEMIRSMEAAVQKLIAAQGEADAYLGKVGEVIRESHESFTNSMVETLRQTNTEFHKHLGSSVSLLASSIDELDHALGNLPSSQKQVA